MEIDNNKQPLGICLYAGLGNQLFMLFACISKAIDEKRDFIIYRNNDNGERNFYFDNILNKIKDKTIICNIWNLNDKVYNEDNNQISIPDNYNLLRGYYQNFNYSYHNRNKIITYLNFDNYLNSHKIPFKVIGIHFRFDDNFIPEKIHLRAKSTYFTVAIQKLQEELKKRNDNIDYKYLIFSTKNDNHFVDNYINDINQELEKPIDFIKSYDYFNNNDDYEELFYMSNCDHFILPHNSTFSLFASYLTYEKNSNKIIIYPDLWDGYGNASTTRFFFDDWIRIYNE